MGGQPTVLFIHCRSTDMANKKTSDTTIRMSEGKVNPRGHFIMFYHSGVLEGTFATAASPHIT